MQRIPGLIEFSSLIISKSFLFFLSTHSSNQIASLALRDKRHGFPCFTLLNEEHDKKVRIR